jgi:hypothetical protein
MRESVVVLGLTGREISLELSIELLHIVVEV